MWFVAVRVLNVETDFLVATHQDRISVGVLDDFALASKKIFDGFRSVIDLRCPLCGTTSLESLPRCAWDQREQPSVAINVARVFSDTPAGDVRVVWFKEFTKDHFKPVGVRVWKKAFASYLSCAG